MGAEVDCGCEPRKRRGMSELIHQSNALTFVAAKAFLLFVTAVFGYRFARRRALADLSIIDFVIAVAVGSIVGRVPNASDASYVDGAVTLIVLLAAHAAFTELRFIPLLQRWIDPRPTLLITDGHVDRRELRRSGLTDGDLSSILRERGIRALADVRYLIFEQRGRFSVVPSHPASEETDVILLHDVDVRSRMI
jgi:uncharacterized membrane protein YcaP (DUF421 family)